MKRLLVAGIALFATALALQWLPAGVPAASAATADVNVSDNVFTPGTLTINAGDTVHWTWSGSNPHSVVSTGTESFSSSIQTTGTFDHTFETAGTFTYQCGVHGAAMPGTIVVQSAAGTTPPAATNTAAAGSTTVPADTATRAAAAATVSPSGSPQAAASTPTRAATSPTLPATGAGGDGGHMSDTTWMLAALALIGTALVGAAGIAIRRRR